jgi:hypothetical protein
LSDDIKEFKTTNEFEEEVDEVVILEGSPELDEEGVVDFFEHNLLLQCMFLKTLLNNLSLGDGLKSIHVLSQLILNKVHLTELPSTQMLNVHQILQCHLLSSLLILERLFLHLLLRVVHLLLHLHILVDG